MPTATTTAASLLWSATKSYNSYLLGREGWSEDGREDRREGKIKGEGREDRREAKR